MTAAQELYEAIKTGDRVKVEALLDAAPELVNGGGASGMAPLMLAIYARHTNLADLLVSRGAEVNIWTAAAMGDLKTVERELNANPGLLGSYSSDGWTPLHLAAFFGHKDLAEFLVARGADVQARSANTMCNFPLHAAVAGRHTEVAAILLSHGADVDGRQTGGYTALHSAAANGDESTILLLLAHEAKRALQNEEGKTPMDMARERDHPRAMELLSL
jgi:ankyrin repeat protein